MASESDIADIEGDTLSRIEEAIEAIEDSVRWRARVAYELRAFASAQTGHRLFKDVTWDEPRLDRRANRLRRMQVLLTHRAEAIATGATLTSISALLVATSEFTKTARRFREASENLLHEAYQVDIGGETLTS